MPLTNNSVMSKLNWHWFIDWIEVSWSIDLDGAVAHSWMITKSTQLRNRKTSTLTEVVKMRSRSTPERTWLYVPREPATSLVLIRRRIEMVGWEDETLLVCSCYLTCKSVAAMPIKRFPHAPSHYQGTDTAQLLSNRRVSEDTAIQNR